MLLKVMIYLLDAKYISLSASLAPGPANTLAWKNVSHFRTIIVFIVAIPPIISRKVE